MATIAVALTATAEVLAGPGAQPTSLAAAVDLTSFDQEQFAKCGEHPADEHPLRDSPCKRRVRARRVQQTIGWRAEGFTDTTQQHGAAAPSPAFAALAPDVFDDSTVAAVLRPPYASPAASLPVSGRVQARPHLGRAPPAA